MLKVQRQGGITNQERLIKLSRHWMPLWKIGIVNCQGRLTAKRLKGKLK